MGGGCLRGRSASVVAPDAHGGQRERMRILVVVGSLQQRSSNRALAQVFARIAPPGTDVVQSARLDALPYYDADRDGTPALPPVATWRQEIAAADGVVFVSPEYGHGMPGAVKNALDWIVGSGEFSGKPCVATCAAPGKGRGLLGLASLVATLRAIEARVIASDPIVVPRSAFAADSAIADPAVDAAVRDLLGRLAQAVAGA